jgi:hypothetical protein
VLNSEEAVEEEFFFENLVGYPLFLTRVEMHETIGFVDPVDGQGLYGPI